MKNQLLGIIVLALLTFSACKQAESNADATSSNTEESADTKKEMTAPDTATFDKRVALLRDYIKAHSEENLDAQSAMIADTLKWSPPDYRGDTWLGKTEFIAAMKNYHDNFEAISYTEGVMVPNADPGGFFAGSAYSKDGGSNDPNGIRCYGIWKAKHSESGKTIGVKWFGIAGFNDDNKIALWSEYWDVNGIAAQLASD